MHKTVNGAASLVLYAASAAVAPDAGPSAGEVLRDLSRPLILPTLWASLDSAERDGQLGEAVAKSRLLMRLLPEWIPGQLYFASRLALDLSRRTDEPERAIDLLLAALAWLDEVRAALPPEDSATAAEILMCQAFFVEVRCGRDPELNRVIRERFGEDGMQLANDYLEQAQELRPSEAVRSRLTYFGPAVIRAALDRGDVETAVRFARLTIERADRLEDRATANQLTAALERLIEHLVGGVEIAPEELDANPYLRELLK